MREAAGRSGGGFELTELDLANLKSVRECADRLLERGEPIDIVIANAGVIATSFGHTADGFEMQFGTNHLGHFVFVNRVAPLLGSGGRVISLSSAGHRYSDIDLQDLNFERTPYDPFLAYGRSKAANILFAVAFDARHRGRGVRETAVHPGGIRRNFGQRTKNWWASRSRFKGSGESFAVEIEQAAPGFFSLGLVVNARVGRAPAVGAIGVDLHFRGQVGLGEGLLQGRFVVR